MQQRVVPRGLIVKAEALTVKANLGQAIAAVDEFVIGDRRRGWDGQRRVHGRLERRTRQHMLDVGQHQLLVLTLVVQAKLYPEPDVRLIASFKQRDDRIIDVAPVGDDRFQRRSGQQPPSRPRMHLPGRVVIRVEDEMKVFVEDRVTVVEGLQDKSLEEPADVCEVPLGRTDVGHRLHDRVLGSQRIAERDRVGTNTSEAVCQVFR